jgi:prefoldin subunit 5
MQTDLKDVLIQRQAHRIGELMTQLEWLSLQLQQLQAQLKAIESSEGEKTED